MSDVMGANVSPESLPAGSDPDRRVSKAIHTCVTPDCQFQGRPEPSYEEWKHAMVVRELAATSPMGKAARAILSGTAPDGVPVDPDPIRIWSQPFRLTVENASIGNWAVELDGAEILWGRHAEAVAEMRRFVAEAQAALAALVRGEGHPK